MKEEARKFAIKRHGDQHYGEQPYSVHLDSVAEIASDFGEAAVVIAYLHDVIEDTNTTLDELESRFGSLVSNCVSILTDEPGANRKERKAKTYSKMSNVSGELELALIVKVADRLANFRACIALNSAGLLNMYKKEHSTFKHAVYRPGLCEQLWHEIEEIISV